MNNLGLPNITYIDSFIKDGQDETISMKNLYETILIRNNQDHICRVPIADFFIQYRRELMDAIEFYNLSESMFYKPKLVSLHLYGTTELWLSLLRLNNMRNITEFHYPFIKVYNSDKLMELINIFFKRNDKIE